MGDSGSRVLLTTAKSVRRLQLGTFLGPDFVAFLLRSVALFR